MTPVLLIRHGRTSWNAEGRIQARAGRDDIVVLAHTLPRPLPHGHPLPGVPQQTLHRHGEGPRVPSRHQQACAAVLHDAGYPGSPPADDRHAGGLSLQHGHADGLAHAGPDEQVTLPQERPQGLAGERAGEHDPTGTALIKIVCSKCS